MATRSPRAGKYLNSEFSNSRVKNIVYRINKQFDEHGLFVFHRERVAESWSRCCEYAANKVNYRSANVKRQTDPWLDCIRDADYNLNKVAWNYDNRWKIREYQILYWMNIIWVDDEHDRHKEMFQATVNREVTNLNDRVKYYYSEQGRRNPKDRSESWPQSSSKARIDLQDVVKGRNRLKANQGYSAVVLQSQVAFRRDLDLTASL